MRRNTKFAIFGKITDIFTDIYVYCVAYMRFMYRVCLIRICSFLYLSALNKKTANFRDVDFTSLIFSLGLYDTHI